MSNELMVTVVGWVASTPKQVVGGDRTPYTSFRLATTPRRFDRASGAWVDGRTEWMRVKAWRDVAFNVAASVRKGDPLLVHGRLATEDWIGADGPRTSMVLEATALGHDLTRGTAAFARTLHVPGRADAAGEAPEGQPTDHAAPVVDEHADLMAGSGDPSADPAAHSLTPPDLDEDEADGAPQDPWAVELVEAGEPAR